MGNTRLSMSSDAQQKVPSPPLAGERVRERGEFLSLLTLLPTEFPDEPIFLPAATLSPALRAVNRPLRGRPLFGDSVEKLDVVGEVVLGYRR